MHGSASRTLGKSPTAAVYVGPLLPNHATYLTTTYSSVRLTTMHAISAPDARDTCCTAKCAHKYTLHSRHDRRAITAPATRFDVWAQLVAALCCRPQGTKGPFRTWKRTPAALGSEASQWLACVVGCSSLVASAATSTTLCLGCGARRGHYLCSGPCSCSTYRGGGSIHRRGPIFRGIWDTPSRRALSECPWCAFIVPRCSRRTVEVGERAASRASRTNCISFACVSPRLPAPSR